MAEEWNQIQSNLVMRRNWNNFLYAKVLNPTEKKRNKLSQKVRSIVVSLRLDHFTKVMTM